MKFISNYRTITVTLVILITVFVIFVFAQTQRQTESRQTSKDVRVEYKTNSLVAEDLVEIRKSKSQTERDNQVNWRTFEVKLKNNSEKPITDFSLVVKDAKTPENSTSGFRRGGMTDGWSLLPNEVDVNRFSAAPEGEVVLVVEGVLFDDGTGEGDSTELLRLRSNRAGMKLAYQEIVPLLQRSLNEKENADPISALQSLEKEVASMSVEKAPMNQKGGYHQAKQYILTELQDLRNSLSSKSKLIYISESEIKGEYTSKIAEQLARIERTIAKF